MATVWRRCGLSDFCLIALLHLLVTLSTQTNRHYNESVRSKKQHTRGNNTIPYKLGRLVTFESLKWKYSFAIVYEIRLIAIREVSPPFDEKHCGIEQDISFPAVLCGVPQGSTLGPILFILYINDMCNVSTLLKPILFVDNTNLFYSGKDKDDLRSVVSMEMDKLCIWF